MSTYDLTGTLFMAAAFGLFYLIGYYHGWQRGSRAMKRSMAGNRND